MNKEIFLTDRHVLKINSVEFILNIKPFDKDGKVNPKAQGTNTYYPTISLLCKDITTDEYKEAIELYDYMELDKRFQDLVAKPHEVRLEKAIRWFERFELEEDTKKENDSLKKQLKKAQAQIRMLRGMSDQEDADRDEDE